MKKLIVFFGCVLLLALPLLTGINYFIEHFLKKQKEDVFGKVNELLEGNTRYDILCLGSSRTLVQIDPYIIDSILFSNSYNAGLDGTTIIECNMLLDGFLQTHTPPAIAILNIETNSLNIMDTTSIFNYPLYLPYLKNKFVSQTLSEYEPAVKVLSVFPFMRPAYYNDFKKYMAVKAFLNPQGSEKNIFYKGYSPMDLTWRGKPLTGSISADYTEKGVRLLLKLFETCKAYGIKPVVVYAPETASVTGKIRNFNAYRNKLKELCAPDGVLFLDYSEAPLTRNEKYFYDYFHLNREGSKVYSLLLADDLKKIFIKK